MFNRRKVRPIGIDFGSCALRVMQLADSGDQVEVIAAASHPYPPRDRRGPREPGEVVEALRAIFREHRFIGKQACSTLGEPDLLVKNIRLPEMPEVELASAVRFEACDRIAELGDDAEIRFIVVGPAAGGDERQQEVIVLAAPACAIRRQLDMLSEAGLDSVSIDPAPCATFRPFERYLRRTEDQEQANMFVDVGWSGTRTVITKGDQIVFTRSLRLGGATFDQVVSGSLSLDLPKVRELRRRIAAARSNGEAHDTGIDQATIDAVDAAVLPVWEKLGKELGLYLRYYAVTFRGARPDVVTCVGGESVDTRYLEHLSEVVGLRCRVGRPLRGLTFADARPLHEDGGAMADWTTALGVSMKPIPRAVESVSR